MNFPSFKGKALRTRSSFFSFAIRAPLSEWETFLWCIMARQRVLTSSILQSVPDQRGNQEKITGRTIRWSTLLNFKLDKIYRYFNPNNLPPNKTFWFAFVPSRIIMNKLLLYLSSLANCYFNLWFCCTITYLNQLSIRLKNWHRMTQNTVTLSLNSPRTGNYYFPPTLYPWVKQVFPHLVSRKESIDDIPSHKHLWLSYITLLGRHLSLPCI